MKAIGHTFERVYALAGRINHFMAFLAGWLILAITLISCYGVFTRYVLEDPDTWSFSVSAYLLCFVIFFCIEQRTTKWRARAGGYPQRNVSWPNCPLCQNHLGLGLSGFLMGIFQPDLESVLRLLFSRTHRRDDACMADCSGAMGHAVWGCAHARNPGDHVSGPLRSILGSGTSMKGVDCRKHTVQWVNLLKLAT